MDKDEHGPEEKKYHDIPPPTDATPQLIKQDTAEEYEATTEPIYVPMSNEPITPPQRIGTLVKQTAITHTGRVRRLTWEQTKCATYQPRMKGKSYQYTGMQLTWT